MRLHVGGSWWQLDRLGSIPGTQLGEAESTAVRLIQGWQSGQQEFTFHTSGSSGTPKSITFQRAQLEASAQLSIDTLRLRPGMIALACLDPRFVAGALMVIRSILADMDLIVREPSANPLRDLAEPVDFVALVPLQLTTVLDELLPQLERTSVVIIGGAPLSDAVVPRLLPLRPAFYLTYGMTETLTHIALQKLNGADRQDAFHALPGVSVSRDDRGCLVIRAKHLGADPISTNDLVSFTPDGGFHILGRFDEVINTGGFKVEPGRVEFAVAQVLQHMGILCRHFAAGIPDDKLGECVGLVLEGSPLPPEVETELKELLASRLDRFEVPRRFLYSARFVETATQKVHRKATLESVLKKTP